jgi:HSP20 family protein
MIIMAIRDLIPWNRQDNRLPAPLNGERDTGGHPLLSLHREVNRLFDDVFRGLSATSVPGFDRSLDRPQVELAETDKEIRVTAELPGLDQKDVDIQVEDGVLTIRGEKRAEVEDKDRGYSQRSYGRFERPIGLPSGVDRGKASATFRNGVLTVTLPRTEAANENVRRIPIHGAAA